MKRNQYLGLLMAACLGCGKDSESEQPKFHQTAPIEETVESKDSETVNLDQLRSKYGPEVVDYASKVVENGEKIRESPKKQHFLYDDLEAKLKQRFPGIQPPKLFGFMDEPREIENISMLYRAQSDVLKRASKDGINLPMSLIVAALCNEGFSLDVDHNVNGTDGFMDYGLDTFGSEFRHIVSISYLPESFRSKFEICKRTNEAGRTVKSASFDSKQDAFEAFVATVAHRQFLFYNDLKTNGIKRVAIPEEEKLFFTYKYYNGGPNSIEALLRKRSAKTLAMFFDRTITYGSTGNAYVVLSGHLWLQGSGATDPNPKGKYWWSK